jgi:hypothetical protein
MAGRIVFKFERSGKLTADILPELAPKTVSSISNTLPFQSTVFHTRWCGREIYLTMALNRRNWPSDLAKRD